MLNNIGVLYFERGEFEVCRFFQRKRTLSFSLTSVEILLCLLGFSWNFFYLLNASICTLNHSLNLFCMLCQFAEQTFKEALGEGIWLSLLDGQNSVVDPSAYSVQYKDFTLFHQLEENGTALDLPWDKVTTMFNYARLFEQLHDTEKASILYRLILFKVSSSLCPLYLHICVCILSGHLDNAKLRHAHQCDILF